MILRILQIILLGIFVTSICFAQRNEIKKSKLSLGPEKKFSELLEGQSEKKRHEASGVLFLNDEIFAVFDNHSMIAKINIELNQAKLLGEDKDKVGFEGIAYDPIKDRFYLIEESLDNEGAFNANLWSADKDFNLKSDKWLKYNFQGKNKGFEGLTIVTKNNRPYILALCEGNDCDAGDISKIHGAGRIKVFKKEEGKWEYFASIRIPPALQFIDYSGIDINEKNILAITSQESSAVWTGELDIDNWQIKDPGHVYPFPKDQNENKIYCNIEGVSWIANDRLVVVSDRKKKEQSEECSEKDQSIHIISISTPNP
jgi:hypothetical protein